MIPNVVLSAVPAVSSTTFGQDRGLRDDDGDGSSGSTCRSCCLSLAILSKGVCRCLVTGTLKGERFERWRRPGKEGVCVLDEMIWAPAGVTKACDTLMIFVVVSTDGYECRHKIGLNEMRRRPRQGTWPRYKHR